MRDLMALIDKEAVTRIVMAAFLQEAPGSFRLQRAYAEAEKIRQELIEEEIAEMARHYAPEMTGE